MNVLSNCSGRLHMRAETFILLEEALAKRLIKAFTAKVSQRAKKVDWALKRGDYDAARALFRRLYLEDLFDSLKPIIQFQTQASMLFGASRVSKSPRTTVVGLGFEQLMAEQMVNGFKAYLRGADEYLVEVGLQLIAQQEIKDQSVAKKEAALGPFESFVDQQGRAYFNMISSLHTSRVSGWGFTAEALALGIVEYQVTEQLDARTCPVCRIMHGKVFKVSDARQLLDQAVRISDKEAIKVLQPWPKQTKAALAQLAGMSTNQIVANHWHVPPYHPRCRGLLTRVGTAGPMKGSSSIPASQNLPLNLSPTVEIQSPHKVQFDILGLKMTPKQMETWKDNVKVSPVHLLAQLSGKPQSALIEGSLKSGHVKDTVGLKKLKLSLKKLEVELETPIGTQNTEFDFADQVVTIEPPSSLLQPPMDQKKWAQIKSIYITSKDMGMGELAMELKEGDYSPTALGFLPNDADWDKIKSTIPQSGVALTEAEKQVVDQVLSSTDPSSILKIIELGEAGEELLSNAQFTVRLKFSDHWAMSKFLSYKE